MRPATCCALLAAAVALTGALSAAGHAEQVVTIGGKCLDIPHGNPTNGTGVQIWRCGASFPGQRWSFPGGIVVGMGGMCLDVEAGHTEDGARVQVWNCTGGANQRWQFFEGELIGVAQKCLDVAGSATDDGTPLMLWHCTGAASQKFMLRPSVISP